MTPSSPMPTRPRPARRAARVAVALMLSGAAAGLLGGCAASGFTTDPNPMPAARLSMRPEYRLFHDALVDYGDWVLIEPYGYAFRPRVAVDLWDPYQDGFWSPTDLYGWVWMSAEPFGWATYHYGRWFRDDYQGWVWVPGLDWAPAWVSWAADEQYVAWAPLAPGRDFDSAAPPSAYRVAPRSSLGNTDLSSRTLDAARLGVNRVEALRPVANIDQVEGVAFNRGPRLEWVEQVRGPLVRARLQDVSPRALAPPGERRPAEGSTAAAPGADEKQAAAMAAQKARQMMQTKAAAPQSLPIVRLPAVPAGADSSVNAPSRSTKTPPAPARKPKSGRGGG